MNILPENLDFNHKQSSHTPHPSKKKKQKPEITTLKICSFCRKLCDLLLNIFFY